MYSLVLTFDVSKAHGTVGGARPLYTPSPFCKKSRSDLTPVSSKPDCENGPKRSLECSAICCFQPGFPFRLPSISPSESAMGWKRCPACAHRWLDKYSFDECPKCLCQLSKAQEQSDLYASGASANMEPIWSQTTSQKMARWSNTLRDTIHSGRTPRHNPR